MEFSDEIIQLALKRYVKDKEYRNQYYKNKIGASKDFNISVFGAGNTNFNS